MINIYVFQPVHWVLISVIHIYPIYVINICVVIILSTIVTVRVTQEERELIEALADYLYKLGKIREPTISEALRACLYFTVNEIMKALEAEKYG